MNEVHVIATVLSVDLENAYDVLAMLGASAALTISEIPFGGPIGSVRVGRIDGEFVVNPTLDGAPGRVRPRPRRRRHRRRHRHGRGRRQARSPRPSSSRRCASRTRRSRSSSTSSSSCSASAASPSGTSPDVRPSTRACSPRSAAGFGAALDAATQVPDKKERQDATADGQEGRRRAARSPRTPTPERVAQVKRAARQAREGHHPRPHRRREAPPRRPRAPTRSGRSPARSASSRARTAAPSSPAARRRL